MSEIRCCEFVRKSVETGFSISTARPVGPPTLSHSDSARRPGRQDTQPAGRRGVEPSAPYVATQEPEEEIGGEANGNVEVVAGMETASFKNLPPLRHTYR